MQTRLITAILAVLLQPLTAQSEPLLREQAGYYYIDGSSAVVLSEQINQKGPLGQDGKRHPSRTRWEVQWKFRHKMQDGVCRLEEVAVAVTVSSVRPRWRGEIRAARQLRERWRRFVDAVERYHDFHKEQALRAGREIETVLRGAAPAKTCEALTEEANRIGEALLNKYLKVTEAYDRKTEYGRKQGATLI
ncbi:MAG TPA: DUF922 domain-containing protein [Burkholderiales bacterium]|jgi:predicted secreted Zn-dependent protease|nr:DUF922 domain-containing protein [Burkholderiales bacterium]